MYPTDLDFAMPAEWREHERTFISWPVRESMRFPEDYSRIVAGYTELVQAVAEFEPVTIIAGPEETGSMGTVSDLPNVHVLGIAHNDSWIRDNGPTFLLGRDGSRAGVNWRFNAWGEKYAPWDLDDRVASMLMKHFRIRRFDAPFVLEGGSIHVDGDGTLLTTEQCLLHASRNPMMGRSDIENELKRFLNVRKIIWLKRGLVSDETDGHVDNVACFAAPGKVLIQICSDPKDENFEMSKENLKILNDTVDARGRQLEVIQIPQPPARKYKESRLTLSYVNFYLVNGGVILPTFGGDAAQTDQQAADILHDIFPERRIRPIDGMALITEGGNVHCATQQLPAVRMR